MSEGFEYEDAPIGKANSEPILLMCFVGSEPNISNILFVRYNMDVGTTRVLLGLNIQRI